MNSLVKLNLFGKREGKIQTIAFSVKDKKVWITIDKNVIRTEIIRIIDGCLPIVKRYS